MAVNSSSNEDGSFPSDFADKLRVLTLNCWGIPFISKLKKERFQAIGEELQKGGYDIIALQEVWDTNDFENLKKRLKSVLPYSFYYYGGVLGTGICIFSRYPIIDTFTYPFLLNGYAYAVAHGDWFGGKKLCFALIDHPVMKIHLFTSHLHAEYDRVNDDYIGHRVTQAYHVANVINRLSKSEDFVILCGDMNSEPSDLSYRIIKTLPGLTDCWDEQGAQCTGNTCDRCENMFTKVTCSAEKIGGIEDGKRIDYVFYRSPDHQCENVVVTMSKVPGENFPYSDHDGVSATFSLNKKCTDSGEVDGTRREDDILSTLTETNTVLKRQSKLLWKNLNMRLILSLLLLVFILFPTFCPSDANSIFAMQRIFGRFLYILRIFLTMFLCGYLWSLLMETGECSNYESTIQEIDIQLARIRSTRD